MERNRRSGKLFSSSAEKVHENQGQGGAHGVESTSPRSKGMDAGDFEKAAVTWAKAQSRQHDRHGKRDGGEEAWTRRCLEDCDDTGW